MSPAQTIAKLQSLLTRVRARAAEPRRHDDQDAAATSASAEPVQSTLAGESNERSGEYAPAEAPPVLPPLVGAWVPAEAAVAVTASARAAAHEQATAPTPVAEPSGPDEGVDVSVEMATTTPPPAASDAGLDIDVDVEVEIDVAEPIAAASSEAELPTIIVDEPPDDETSESAERMVAARPAFADAAAEATTGPFGPPLAEAAHNVTPEPAPVREPELLEAAASTASLQSEPLDSWGPPGQAPEPDPPTSPERMSEPERESEPLTPADETGAVIELVPASSRRPLEPEERLAEIAFGTGAPQSPRHTPPPESGQLPAAPPDEFDADVTGVRDSMSLAKGEASEPPPPAGLDELVPETTRVAFEATGAVVSVMSKAHEFVPATFAELLEATLAL